MLGGLDESAVAPDRRTSRQPGVLGHVRLQRAVPHYMAGDDATAAELAGQAVALARAAGALIHWPVL